METCHTVVALLGFSDRHSLERGSCEIEAESEQDFGKRGGGETDGAGKEET